MANPPPNIHRENPKGFYQPIIEHGGGSAYSLSAWQSGVRFRASLNDSTFSLPDVGVNSGDIWSVFHLQADVGITGVTVDVTDVTPVGTKIYYKGADKGTSITIPPGCSLSIVAVSEMRWDVVGQIGVYAESGTVVESARGEFWCDEINGDDTTGDGSPSNPYETVAKAYTVAKASTPGGQALSTTNRATVRCRKGNYPFSASYKFDAEYVDIVGEGQCQWVLEPGTTRYISYPQVVLQAMGNALQLACNDALFQALTFEQTKPVSGETYCLRHDEVAATRVFMKDVGFRETGTEVGTVRAIYHYRTVGNVKSNLRMQDCHTELTGLMYGGYWDGAAQDCSGNDYSFCGYNGASMGDLAIPAGAPVEIDGEYVDCWGKNFSFGALNDTTGMTGTTVTCKGVHMRNSGNAHCFGAVADPNAANVDIPAVSTGTYVNCKGTTNSFGYSATGAATASGAYVDCVASNYSYGSTVGISGQTAKIGTFSGAAYRTQAGTYSYGYGPGDLGGNNSGVIASTAVFEDCIGGSYSFSARGTCEGTFRRCHASGCAFGVGSAAQDLRMEDCRLLNIAASSTPEFYSGTIERCTFTVVTQGTDAPLKISGDDVELYDCDLYGDSITESIDADAAQNIRMAHCRMNVGVNANVTNLIGSPYNVVDSNFRITN